MAMDVRKLIDELAEEEDAFFKRSFLAPMVKGGNVGVRLKGIVCRFVPEDRTFEGWGIFQPISLHKVKLKKIATPTLVRKYLDQLTSVELIVASPSGRTRIAIVAHPPGSLVKVDGPIPVHLVKKADQFRHIIAGFDGFNFWFDRIHPGRNPAISAYLIKSLHKDLEVKELDRPGLLPQEKRLYADLLKLERIHREEPQRRRLRKALEHAGATLDFYRQRKDSYNVTFVLDGTRHTSIVRSDDLTVLSAGICLSEEDEKFDLQSLVSVLREARHVNGFD